MVIKLSPRERDKLQAAAEILEEYSRLYSEIIKGKTGTFYNDAGSAAGMIRNIIKHEADGKNDI